MCWLGWQEHLNRFLPLLRPLPKTSAAISRGRLHLKRMGVRTSSTDFVCNLTHPQEQYVMISYVVNVALNGVFSITAALENAVMLVALVKTCDLLARSRALFINLAITDLAASITSQPLWSAVLNAALHDTPILCATLKKAADMSASILCGVSIATITLISVDRLLALRSPHHPGTKTSQSKKLQVLLTFVWIASVAVALTKLWNFRIFLWFSFCRNFHLCSFVVLLLRKDFLCYFQAKGESSKSLFLWT